MSVLSLLVGMGAALYRKRWIVLPRGGHFVAMEDPASLVHEIGAFVHALEASR